MNREDRTRLEEFRRFRKEVRGSKEHLCHYTLPVIIQSWFCYAQNICNVGKSQWGIKDPGQMGRGLGGGVAQPADWAISFIPPAALIVP